MIFFKPIIYYTIKFKYLVMMDIYNIYILFLYYSSFIILFSRDANLNILSGLDDIQTVLDDHLIKTISIRGSAFVKPIKNEVNEWFELVKRMNMTLEEWAKVQIQWLYLLPIFSSKDIIAQMPEEGSLFHVI